MSLRAIFIAMVWLGIQSQNAKAQVTVQQPVFGVTNVTTTVSVPDRGRAHLGSISRARDSRSHFGPFRPGTNTGLDREHTGLSVGVYIHDFEEMDRYLLGQGGGNPALGSRLSGNAGHAWNQLQAHHGSSPTTRTTVSQPVDKSAKYWRLGQKSEEKGNISVAKMHYRIASKYGSLDAKTRLAELDAPTTNTQIANRNR